MRTKATDRIVLSSGEVVTLRDAIDRGLVVLGTAENWTRNTDIPRKVITHIAREVGGDRLFWIVSSKLTGPRGVS